MQLLTEKDVHTLVNLREVRELLRGTLSALPEFPESPPRFAMGKGSAQLGVMPETGKKSQALKIVSLAKGKGHEGVLTLFDHEGRLLGLIEAGVVTALRTAAASVVMTEALCPQPKKIAVIGKGRQGVAHIAAFAAAFPEAGIIDSMNDADVICTTTTAIEPLFFPLELPDRVHINAIGSCVPTKREIPEHIVNQAKVFCDSDRALNEAGDLVLAGIRSCTLVDKVLNDPTAFRMEKGVSLFKSIGLPCEDIALAELIVERAYG